MRIDVLQLRNAYNHHLALRLPSTRSDASTKASTSNSTLATPCARHLPEKVRLTRFERGGYGYYVILHHANGLETVYGHLSRFLVKPNQTVNVGDYIALGGSTGRSTGPHLRETRFMGYAINPCAIFDFANQTTDYYTFNKGTYTQARNYAPSSSVTYAESAQAGQSVCRRLAPNLPREEGRHALLHRQRPRHDSPTSCNSTESAPRAALIQERC